MSSKGRGVQKPSKSCQLSVWMPIILLILTWLSSSNLDIDKDLLVFSVFFVVEALDFEFEGSIIFDLSFVPSDVVRKLKYGKYLNFFAK